MKTISIMNVKGGVGKTITATNLAEICAGEYGRRVLLIDVDAQGDATQLLLPGEEDPPGTYGALVMGGSYEDHIYHTRYRNLDIMPATTDLFYLAMEASTMAVKAMEDLIEVMEHDDAYDLVIIDCPTCFTAASIAAICASDHVVIPVKLDKFGLHGCDLLTKQIEALYDFNPAITVGALVTMWRNVDVCTQSLELLKDSGIPVYNTKIRRTDKVDESTFYCMALGEYSRFSSAGRDYRAFAAELLPMISEVDSNGL